MTTATGPGSCARCGRAAPPGVGICQSCAAPAALRCERCRRSNPPGDRFCGGCGGPLADPDDVGPPAPLLTSVGGARYEIAGLLGEGARKRVYRAVDRRLDRVVALALMKTDGLDQVGLDRVRHEARAMGRLGDHAHIVTVYDVADDDDGTPYIVSKYLAGGDLEGLLRRSERQRVPLPDAVRVAEHVAAALEHVHAHGLVHRDVKPANIWLDADGSACLGDFGLAVPLDPTSARTETMIVGTVTYLAPEQAMGRAPDVRSDLYGLGVVLYEMVTGRPPFTGDDALTLISQHLHAPPDAPSTHNPDVPVELEALILRLLAKAPEDRLPDASAVRAALAEGAATVGRAAVDGGVPARLDDLGADVFVGREAEVGVIRGACDDALAGRGRLVLIAGEPGIGKTRTSEEVATYADSRGALVLWGHCYEGDGAPAYWPWVQVLRALVRDRDLEDLRHELGPGASVIAHVFPEVHERLPDVGPPPERSSEQARFVLFDALTAFLKNVAQRQPLVLVLDDLHWADESSLLLLRHVVGELAVGRLLLLGTYRDIALRRDHPLAATLGQLQRHAVTRRVALRGLSAADVARYIELATGRPPPSSLVEAVNRETEGNPFFLIEVVRLLAAEGRLEATSTTRWSVSIPQGVREVIGRRLELLTATCNEVLAAAAVIGREFALDVLRRVTDRSLDEVLDALEEAVSAQVLEADVERAGRYRFAHALIRETLYDELPVGRRIGLHRRVGIALEAIFAGRQPPLAELAHHFSRAAPGGDVDKAVEYASLAAAQADAALAYEEAARLSVLALQDLELAVAPDLRRRGALLMALGGAHKRASRIDEARAAFAEAAAIARQLADPHLLGWAALGFAKPGLNAGMVDEPLRVLLAEAIAAIGDEVSGLRSRLLSRLSMELYFADDRSDVAALGDLAVAVAREAGDAGALAAALFVQATDAPLCRPPGGSTIAVVERGYEAAREAAEVARVAGDRELEAFALIYVGSNLIALEREGEASIAMRRFAALAEELRQPFFLWHGLWFAVHHASARGDLSEALQLSDDALALGGTVAPVDARLGHIAQLLAARRGREDLDRLAEEVTVAREVLPRFSFLLAAAAVVALERGASGEARAQLAALAADGFAGVPDDVFRSTTLALAAEVAVGLEQPETAALLYDTLLPEAPLTLVFGAGAGCFGATSRCLGLLAGTMGRHEEAEAHLEDARQRHAHVQARPWLARTLISQAELLVRPGTVHDTERAVCAANEALELAQRMGMTSVADRALAVKLRAQDTSELGASLHAVAMAVAEDPPDLRRLVPGADAAETVTILFTDIERSTELAERLGDRGWLQVLRAHNELIRSEVRANHGMEVKHQGDGFMLAFASARRAIAAAVGVQRSLVDRPIRVGEDPIRVRIGLHTGEALREGDDFFGHHVTLAARIAAAAGAGEVLVSALTADLVAGGDRMVLGPWRDLELKGFGEPQRVAPVRWQALDVPSDVDARRASEEAGRGAST